jgi:hypothetical protein
MIMNFAYKEYVITVEKISGDSSVRAQLLKSGKTVLFEKLENATWVFAADEKSEIKLVRFFVDGNHACKEPAHLNKTEEVRTSSSPTNNYPISTQITPTKPDPCPV